MDETLDPRRRLALAGAHNVRDLGGYRTQSGYVTCWGRFLRASAMHRLTDDDREALVQYGLRTVVEADPAKVGSYAATLNIFDRAKNYIGAKHASSDEGSVQNPFFDHFETFSCVGDYPH